MADRIGHVVLRLLSVPMPGLYRLMLPRVVLRTPRLRGRRDVW